MTRQTFFKLMALMPFTSVAMKLRDLENITNTFNPSDKMPVIFFGHGNPMNAIEENEFTQGFSTAIEGITKPTAILCISAHWETKGTHITSNIHPKTIHDFGGFPKALFDVQYPAPGHQALASEIKSMITKPIIELDDTWGLDHGAWSLIKHLYPKADVPVLEMSIDYTQPAQYHYDLAKQLQRLRYKGVLIIGSGNMVHNLGMVAWDKFNTPNYAFDWALEASTKMKQWILEDNHKELIQFKNQGKVFDLAIPTPEHYLPLIYSLALKEDDETVTLFNDKAVAGSLTMTSVKIS